MQYLYVILCQQYAKIGVANDVESRLVQLSTGNPFPLEVWAVYEFENAELVERAIHQKLKDKRVRGEWFELTHADTTELHTLCLMLGGRAFEYTGKKPDEESIEEAEEIQEESLDKWDYAQMFLDGWRMETVNENGRARNWTWRRGNNLTRKSLYGGSMNSLPHPIEEMRRIYRDGGLPAEELDPQ